MTQVIRRRGVVGPPSLRAQILLVVSAFLCGTVLAGLLFVGIWRQTADNGTRAQLTQRATERRLVAAQHKLSAVSTQLRQTHSLLTTATHRAAQARASLRTQIASNATMSGRLSATAASARSLATQLSTLESELTTLEGYARRPGPAGIDAAYLATQVQYLRSSAAAAAAAAAKLTH